MRYIKKLSFVALSILFLAVGMFVFAFPPVTIQQTPEQDWDFPRLEQMYMIEAWPSSVMLEKARASDIDIFIGAIQAPHVAELSAPPYNWTVTQNPGYHMCYLGANCRDYTPDTSGSFWDFFGRTPGFSLYPMNVSQFRMALELIVGCQKDAWLAEMYEFINVRLDTVVPPANSYWYNPYILPYPEDWTKAAALLYGAGFTGTPGVDDWQMGNGVMLRDRPAAGAGWGGNVTGIIVITVGPALSTQSNEIALRHIRKWNEFFMGSNTTQGIFKEEPDNTFEPLILVPFYNRDHDIYFLCWGLGRDPDSLYYFFHPEQDLPGANNSPGLDHPGTNALLKAMQFWKIRDLEVLWKNVGEWDPFYEIVPSTTYWIDLTGNPTAVMDRLVVERVSQADGVYEEVLVAGVHYNIVSYIPGVELEIHIKAPIILYIGDALELWFATGTYHRVITDVDEMRNLVWLLQWKLYYLVPYLPVYSRNYINLFKPGLTGWADTDGYGTAAYQTTNPWTFNNLYWEGEPTGGNMSYTLAGDITTLNLIRAAWVYEVTLLNRMFDTAYVVHPYTQQNVPWGAIDWEMIPWDDPDGSEGHGIVPNGMILRVWLRDDLYWHDDRHITAGDVKWELDFIESIEAPENFIIWDNMLYTAVADDYQIDIYINATGLWLTQAFLGSMFTFPKVIYESFWGDYTSLVAFNPDQTRYDTHTGLTPPADRPDLTCLIGTGPWILDFWNEVDVGRIYANRRYWHGIIPPFPGNEDDPTTPQPKNPVMTAVKAPSLVYPEGPVTFEVLAQSIDIDYTRTVSCVVEVDGVVHTAATTDMTGISLNPVDFQWFGPYTTGTLTCGEHHINVTHTEAETGRTFVYVHRIFVTIKEDQNRDGFIDGRDLGVAGRAYGSFPGHPGWWPFADINGDDFIDGRDLGAIGRKYGQSCPYP